MTAGSSPGSGSGDEPFGGPALGGQRPTGSPTEPASDPPAASASDPDVGSADGPPGGGQRPADSATRPAAADRAVVSDTRSGEADSGSDTADRFPPQAGREAGPEAEPAPALDPIAQLTKERDEYRDALVRLQADFENYKKRILKQQTEHLERAAEALVDKLLPVLDTADLALAHGGGEEVKQVTAALTAALEREGLERIDPIGSPFDPTLHDAVAHEPSDGGEQVVVEVMRAGYRWKGRVLRPALVKVRG